MRVRTIRWKRDPFNCFDRMRDDPWWCYEHLRGQGAVITGMSFWEIWWPE